MAAIYRESTADRLRRNDFAPSSNHVLAQPLGKRRGANYPQNTGGYGTRGVGPVAATVLSAGRGRRLSCPTVSAPDRAGFRLVANHCHRDR